MSDEGSVRPTRSNTHKSHNGITYSTSVRGVNGVMLPNGLTKEEYDKLMKEKSGECIIVTPAKNK